MLRLIDSVWEYSEVVDSLLEIKVAVMRMMPIYNEDYKINFGNKQFPINWRKLHIINGSFAHRNTESEEERIFSIENLKFYD
jgi:hypothetical protein